MDWTEPSKWNGLPTALISDAQAGIEVSWALQEVINGLPNGEGLESDPSLWLRCDYGVDVQGREGLRFRDINQFTRLDVTKAEGDGRRANFRHWHAKASAKLGWRRCRVSGPRPTDAPFDEDRHGWHGFALDGVEGAVLHACGVDHVRGDFVYAGDFEGRRSSAITVLYGRYEQAGRHGFGLTNVSGMRIARLSAGHIQRSLVDAEPNDTTDIVEGVRVISCTGFGKIKNRTFSAHGKGIVRNVKIHLVELTEEQMILELAGGPGRGDFEATGVAGVGMLKSSLSPVNVRGWAGPITVRWCTQQMDPHRKLPGVKLERVGDPVVVGDNDFPGSAREMLRL